MTKQEIEQIVSKLKAYVDEQFAGYGQEEIECVSFEREYMRRLADDMPVRQGLFRLFLRNLNSMLKRASVEVDASPDAIPALIDGKLADSGLSVDENGIVLYNGVRVDFIQHLNATQYSEFDNVDKKGIYFYSSQDEKSVHQSGFLFVMRSSDLKNDTKQIRIEVGGIKERTAERKTSGPSRLIWSDWKELGTQGGSGVGKPGSGESSEVFNDMENNQAAGDCAHAEGTTTTAAGYASHAEGSWTQTSNEAEHAEGAYNKSNTGGSDSGKTLHSVGIGTADNARKNAHEIMLNGDHYVYGIGGYDGTNPGTAKTLQEVVNEAGGGGDITDLGVVSGWNDVVDTGIYKYTLTTENGISGLLFVTSAPKRDGSGKDHYQVRMEAGKIYSRTGESLKIVSGRYTWQDWEEVGGGSSVEVVQSTGQSTTAVMSQKAVTDELAKKAGTDTATQMEAGLMSAADKKKLDGLSAQSPGGGSSVSVVQSTGQSTTAVMSQKAVTDELGKAYLLPDDTKDELIQIDWGKSTNGEPLYYIDHWLEDLQVADPTIFTYDEQVHTLKLAQFTVHLQEGDLSFIADNSRGVLLDPTWSYVNFICPNEPRYFSARIGGKCVLVDTNGGTSGDHYIQLFAEAAYSASTESIEVSIFAEYKLSGGGEENNPLYINDSLAGRLRIWIV